MVEIRKTIERTYFLPRKKTGNDHSSYIIVMKLKISFKKKAKEKLVR